MTNNKKMNDALAVFCVFLMTIAIHLFFHLVIFNFDRALRIYFDELRYYSLARSLFNGLGLMIRGVSSSYQKVGYPLVIMPTFAISDVALRLKIIGVVNIIVISLSVFPIWLICRELKLERRATYCVVILTAIWPDMFFSMTYMSEVLYWPLSALFFYVWLVNERRKSKVIAVIEGLLAYYIYLTKEVFLAVLISYAAFMIIYPMLSLEGRQNKVHDKDNIKVFLVFVCTFIACYSLMKLTVFKGLGNSYSIHAQMGLHAVMSPYRFFYMLYSFFYYVSAILAASLIVPIIYPVIRFKSMSDANRKFFCHLILFGLSVSATIAYTIMVRENLGDITPSIHLRYLGSFFVLLIISFFSSLQDTKPVSITANQRLIIWLIVIYTCFMFRGMVQGSSVDQYILLWYVMLERVADALFPPAGKWQVFFPSAIIACILLSSFVFLFHRTYTRRGRLQAQRFFMIVSLITCIGLNVAVCAVIRYAYRVNSDTVSEVVSINNYFKNDKDSNVMYLVYGNAIDNYDRFGRYMDTYMERLQKFYYVNGNGLREDNIKISDLLSGVETVEYIILCNPDSQGRRQLINVEPVKELTGKYYSVYKNLDASVLKFGGQRNLP